METPKAKKRKLSTGQQSLDKFFSSPSSKCGEGSEQKRPRLRVSPVKRDDERMAERREKNRFSSETPESLEDSAYGRRAGRKNSPVTIDVDRSPSDDDAGIASSQYSGSDTRRTAILPISIDISSSSPPQFEDLSIDPILFDLSGRRPWPRGTPSPYSFLVHALSMLSQTRSRIQILNILTNCLRVISLNHPQSLLPTLYIMSNSLSPSYYPTELGLGPSVITKALQQVSGHTHTYLSKLYKTLGDPGDVAFAAKSSLRTLVPHRPLTIIGVYEALLRISRVQGQGAAKQKQSIVEKLLLSAKGEEVRYLVRTLFLNLRVRASLTSMLSALAKAMVMSPPRNNESIFCASSALLSSVQTTSTNGKQKDSSDLARQELTQLFVNAEALVKRCFVQHPNLDDLISALLDVGLDGLGERVPLTVGVPVYPTLGSPMRSLDEVYERLQGLPFTAELKYDGQRAQIHGYQDETGLLEVKIFSRHLEDMTDKYPDVFALTRVLFGSNAELSSFIMDAEIVAVDRDTGALKSFQDLSQRARKGVKIEDVKVSVCVYAFDVMYLNGQVLLELPFRKRRDFMRQNFRPVIPDDATVARLDHVQSCESENGRIAVEEFWQQALEGRSEGLMVKLLDGSELTEQEGGKAKTRRKPLPATYEPDKRTSAWLKLKKDYVTGVSDSLDLVPIGAWHGMGRKAQWWSPVLLGLYDDTSGEFVAVTKCMTGFTDAFYKEMKERYPEKSDTCAKIPRWSCRLGGFKPSVYFKPQEVWEIRCADITLSPVSEAAIGLAAKRGLSVRFPRFIKVREEKALTQASTPEFLVNLWRVQENRGKEKAEGVDDGELVDESDSEIIEEDDDI